MTEPLLSQEDISVWETWTKAFEAHSKTLGHLKRVDSAKRVIDTELATSLTPQIGWSAGKDSTALTHLIIVGCGAKQVQVISEKDDLDFPGEEDYVTSLARQWGVQVDILHPKESPVQFIKEATEKGHLQFGYDIHSSTIELTKRFFYAVVEEASKGHDLLFLGLRKDESRGRNVLRASRGMAYTVKSGQRRVIPLADWSGMDVYAYLHSVEVEPLPLYKCIGLMHRDEPWRLRKSWWLPGIGARWGQVVWLRRYWPNLYRQLCQWLPASRMLT